MRTGAARIRLRREKHRRRRLHADEEPLVIDRRHEVEILLGERLHAAGAQHTRIRHEDVEAAKRAHRLMHRVCHRVRTGDVGRQPDYARRRARHGGVSAHRLQFLDRLRRRRRIHVQHRHVRALRDQVLRDAEPEPLRAAGDHRDLARHAPVFHARIERAEGAGALDRHARRHAAIQSLLQFRHHGRCGFRTRRQHDLDRHFRHVIRHRHNLAEPALGQQHPQCRRHQVDRFLFRGKRHGMGNSLS